MSEITSERRLTLLREIREANEKNRSHIMNHQHTLYGTDSNDYDKRNNSSTVINYETEGKKQYSTFLIRLFISITILILFILMDKFHIIYHQVNTEFIMTLINQSVELLFSDFIQNISTLFDFNG